MGFGRFLKVAPSQSLARHERCAPLPCFCTPRWLIQGHQNNLLTMNVNTRKKLCIFLLASWPILHTAKQPANNQTHKPKLAAQEEEKTLQYVASQAKPKTIPAQGFHVVHHLVHCKPRILWEGWTAVGKTPQSAKKVYCVVTDDDKLYTFLKKPTKHQAVQLWHTLNLASYAFTELTSQQSFALVAGNPHVKNAHTDVVPFHHPSEVTRLLHAVRYATKQYYRLDLQHGICRLDKDRPLKAGMYHVVQCICQSQATPTQRSIYLCVDKYKLQQIQVSYKQMAAALHRFFGADVLALACYGSAQNLAPSLNPINWQAQQNRIFVLTLAPLPANPFPKRVATVREKQQNICKHILQSNKNLDNPSSNETLALACPIYLTIKEQYIYSEDNLKHMQEHDHLSLPPCRYGRNCRSFTRIAQNTKNNEEQYLYDRSHVVVYAHPPVCRRREKMPLNGEYAFAYQNDFATMHHIDLRLANPLHKIAPEQVIGDGELRSLLLEVVKHDFTGDLITDETYKESPLAKKALAKKIRALKYVTRHEVPLLAIIDAKMKHKTHIRLGKPLDRASMCALILYTGCDCNYAFCKAQREGKFHAWPLFDRCLMRAIVALHRVEDKTKRMLYSGLRNVRFDTKQQFGFLKTYTSSSWDKSVALGFKGGATTSGMLMYITPAMQAVFPHADVIWISKFPKEKELLFARSADIGLLPAPKWQATVFDEEQKTQLVRFEPAAPEIVVPQGQEKLLAANKLHVVSYIKLEKHASLSVEAWSPTHTQGGHLRIRCLGVCILEEHATIHVNGKGYSGKHQAQGYGPGGGLAGNHCAGGGSHATSGTAGRCIHEKKQQTARPGTLYGRTIPQPKATNLPLGSGGGYIAYANGEGKPGTAGGGSLSILIEGKLIMKAHASLQANGMDTDWHGGGAGSGGTLLVHCKGGLELAPGMAKQTPFSACGGKSLGKHAAVRGAGGQGSATLLYATPNPLHVQQAKPLFLCPDGVAVVIHWMRMYSLPKLRIVEESIVFALAGKPYWYTHGASRAVATQTRVPKQKEVLLAYYDAHGHHCIQQGQHDLAVRYHTQAITCRTRWYGKKAPSLAASYKALALAKKAQKDFAGALQAEKAMHALTGGKTQPLKAVLQQLRQAQQKEVAEDFTVTQGLGLYVPLQTAARPVHDLAKAAEEKALQPFNQAIDDFLNVGSSGKQEEKEEKKTASHGRRLLLGSSGAGKSLAGRYLEERLWKQWEAQQKNKQQQAKPSWIPLFISLPRFYASDRSLVTRALLEKGLGLLAIERLQQAKHLRFLLILDGFDEILTQYQADHTLPKKLWERLNVAAWRGNCMVSCRSQVLDTAQELAYFGNTTAIHLVPFSVQQVDTYIQRFAESSHNVAGWKAKKYKHTLDQLGDLKAMASEPFSLGLVLHVLPRLHIQYAAKAHISRAQVYAAFSEQWLERQIQREKKKETLAGNIEKRKQGFNQYCEALGWAMLQTGKQIMQSADTKAADWHVWEQFFSCTQHIHLASAPLRRVGKGTYMFIHKSYQEFFAAAKIVAEILGRGKLEGYSNYFAAHGETYALNQKLLMEEVPILRFLGDQLQTEDAQGHTLQDYLWEIILASKKNKNLAMAANNSMTILNAANLSFSGRDLSGIHASVQHKGKHQGPNLVAGFFYRTKFCGADLRGTFFANACLPEANLTQAQLQRTSFGFLLLALTGHIDSVESVTFAPDGKTLASANRDKTIRIWDTATGACLHTLQEHGDRVNSVAFAPDGKTIASASRDKTIRIWDTGKGTCLRILQGHTFLGVNSVAFSPDGTTLASASDDKTICLWDTDKGTCLRTLTGHTNYVKSVTFTPDGKTIASASDDKTIRLWDTDKGTCLRTLTGHTNWVRSVAFAPDGLTLASASRDKSVKVWNLATGTCLRTLTGHTSWVESVAFPPDGTTIVSASDDETIRLWDTDKGTCLRTLTGHTNTVWSVAFSPDGKTIASASDDKTLRIWDTAKGTCLRTLKGHTHWLNSVAFAPDGTTLASASNDKTLRIWDLATGNCLRTLTGHEHPVAFAANGTTLASAGGEYDKPEIKVWDTKTWNCLRTLQGHEDEVNSVAFAPDGTTLASAGGEYKKPGEIKVWDTKTWKCLHTLMGHTYPVFSVAFAPDGQTLASASEDKLVKVWDAKTGKLRYSLQDPHRQALNLHGTILKDATGIDVDAFIKKVAILEAKEEKKIQQKMQEKNTGSLCLVM